MEYTRVVREALTCSLDKFGVQFECNNRNGEVSQVQFQSPGNDVDVSIGTGTDVGLLAICCGGMRMKSGLCKCKEVTVAARMVAPAYAKQQTSVKGQPHVLDVLREARNTVQTFRFHP